MMEFTILHAVPRSCDWQGYDHRVQAAIKKEWCGRVRLALWEANSGSLPAFRCPVDVRFTRLVGYRGQPGDSENWRFVAGKLILDALVKLGCIYDDSDKYVTVLPVVLKRSPAMKFVKDGKKRLCIVTGEGILVEVKEAG